MTCTKFRYDRPTIIEIRGTRIFSKFWIRSNLSIRYLVGQAPGLRHVEPRDINILRRRQNERHFADAIFKCISLNENVWIPIKISLNFVPKGQINNIPALVQIMAWCRPGDKPLSEPMMVSLTTYICVTRPQWVNRGFNCYRYYMNVYVSGKSQFENSGTNCG